VFSGGFVSLVAPYQTYPNSNVNNASSIVTVFCTD